MAVWPYSTETWKRLREQKLSRDPLCEYCPDGSRKPAQQVDHIRPVRAGGAPFDWRNLASACPTCHSRKTRHIDVMGKDCVPVKGVDPQTGLPLDPNHWWRKPKKSLRARRSRPSAPQNF